ncbi:penicillin-insensitive murein endopeptidase [Shewanella sp. Scap07]|uniref:penicillin-insensitive murein endopeptidase n=1 Tax=Shewanella sp. Scap07 TaxID=2589987 RepID=UPI001C4D0FA5|nr:penicillin-insensitive murein endopeptidase [Shewanella sp. Scap07]
MFDISSYRVFVRTMLLMLLTGLLPSHVTARSWDTFDTPVSGEAASIGSYANGCISGAKALPLVGEGYQVIRTQRGRYYGHPDLVNFIEQLSKTLHQSNDGYLLIGDMSMPRGGRFQSGHRSHQSGLDVDIWFRQAGGLLSDDEREQPSKLDVVQAGTFSVNQYWHQSHADMIRQAALNPKVARIFVNPAIKHQLCSMQWQDDSWLQRVRPWWGHSLHMHVRLRCPAGDALCQNQAEISAGNGCDELAWWQQQITAPKKPQTETVQKPKAKPKPMQPQCRAMLNG